MGYWVRVLAIEKVYGKLPPPALLVDAGCGDCSYSLRIGAKRKVGLDMNPPREKGIETIKCDIGSIPLAGEVADSVICLDVIEHVAEDNRIVGEFHRILNDGGTLILTTPTRSDFMPSRILRKLFKMETATLHQEWRHLRVYDESQLVNLLERNGFRVAMTKDIYQPLTRLLEPENWYHGLRRMIGKPAKSSMDKDFKARSTRLISRAGKYHDIFFKLILTPLVKWIEATGNNGFTHIIVCQKRSE